MGGYTEEVHEWFNYPRARVPTILVPRPPPFLFSVCAHNNTRERMTGEKRGRPGSIHYVSGREVDVGREGPIFKYIRTKLESEFFTSQDK